MYLQTTKKWTGVVRKIDFSLNHFPHMPLLGSSYSAANKDMMSKILTNLDTIFWLSRKHCVKRRNCSLRAISSFPTMFSKAVCCWCVNMSIHGVKGKPFTKQQNSNWFKLKGFADDKMYAPEKFWNLFLNELKNIVGKGENAGYQYFLLCFSKGLIYRVIKSLDCLVKS